MKSIRRFVYAAALTLSALSASPSLASGQEARGRFKLTHEVHWENTLLPAGDYYYSVEARGPSELLQLRSLSGTSPGLMMLTNDTTPSQPQDLSQIVLATTPAGSYVSAMELPDSGLTLHFTVPASPREMARADSGQAATSAR